MVKLLERREKKSLRGADKGRVGGKDIGLPTSGLKIPGDMKPQEGRDLRRI